jgi:hypothetical protein
MGRATASGEHSATLAVSLFEHLGPKNGDDMSDPRHSDPRRNDPLRRFDLRGSGGAGVIWTWLAAIIATVIVLGLVIGYSRTNQASLNSKAPATTGSAPSGLTHTPRPVPKSGDLPAPPPAAPTPVKRPQDRDL